jgi:hypothetical protein
VVLVAPLISDQVVPFLYCHLLKVVFFTVATSSIVEFNTEPLLLYKNVLPPVIVNDFACVPLDTLAKQI